MPRESILKADAKTDESGGTSLLQRPVSFRARPRALLMAAAIAVAPTLTIPSAARASTLAPKGRILVRAGETLVLQQTTQVSQLTVEEGGTITAPPGSSLTLTVNSVETGSQLTALTDSGGVDTPIGPGTYRGDVVLTVAEANPVTYNGLTFPFRQALYVGGAGVVTAKSVLDAVVGGRLRNSLADNLRLDSTGESFNGVYVSDGSFTLRNPKIRFVGNARCDFVGYGAAVVGTGPDTRLVLDGATIDNRGVVRTGVVADATANVIVKNSRIHTADGELPEGYVPTSDVRYMIVVPWMLGLSGNVRATNLLGANTKATYINSHLSSENWGVLSVDGGRNCVLTAINSKIFHTGDDGYGSYVIGNVTEHFLGTEFDVATYATINWGGSVHYGDSTPQAVASLNEVLALGLTGDELAALPERPTVINSGRFGVMWQGTGSVHIDGGTQVTTREAIFLVKAAPATVTVDGSQGARLSSENGIIFQLMDNDNPGRVNVEGKPWSSETKGVYTEPTGDPERSSFDVTMTHSTDATASFTDISVRGDFNNSIRGGTASLAGMNLVLTFTDSRVEGVISATKARHRVGTITSAEYHELGTVTNTVQEVVNNGVIVDLAGRSTWTVAGTSYLSKLVVGSDATITAAAGKTVAMTVDGTPTTITPGASYTGSILLSVG